MKKIIGYMITWTTYGSWLQGDKRGYVYKGNVLAEDGNLKQVNRKNLRHKPIKLNKKQKEVVKSAIIKESRKLNQKIFAIAVCTNHIHLIVENVDEMVGTIAGEYKRAATKMLRKDGLGRKVWTKGYDKRFISDETKLRNMIEYVNRHNEKRD